MTNILNYLNKNYHIITLALLFYGLSISIFLKEINIILLKNFDLKIIIIYRFLIILFSLYFFLKIQKKINYILIIYLLIFCLFLYNCLNGQELNFEIDPKIFYKEVINVKFDEPDIFFKDKEKILIISFLNIFLPLFVFSVSKNFKINIVKFKSVSLKVCDLFLYPLFILLIYKFIMINSKLIAFNEYVNLHSMIYILNIHVILILDKLKNDSKKLKLKNLFNIFVIISCFLLAEATIHLLISLLSGLVFIYFDHLSKKFFIFSLIIFSFLVCASYFIFTYFEMENIYYVTEPGELLNSIYVRVINLKYFLFYTNNFNVYIGNNIFIENIYTYPHNIFVDIYVCTGVVGILIFFLISIKVISNVKSYYNKENLFLFIILFQSLVFSNFSGFLFTNIIFNTSLAAILCLFTENESLIKNSS